jgi:hypothetical protein
MRRKGVTRLRTATPSNVEPEIAALGRRRDVHVSTEGKLAIHAIPDKDKDHGAKHLRCRLPDSFSGINVSTMSIVTLQHTRLPYFRPLVWVLSEIFCRR